MRQDALERLALANKAGLVVMGFEKLVRALEAPDGQAIVVLLHAADAAADGRKKLDRRFLRAGCADRAHPSVIDLLSRAELSLALGRENVVHAGLREGGATRAFSRAAERLACYLEGDEGGREAKWDQAAQ